MKESEIFKFTSGSHCQASDVVLLFHNMHRGMNAFRAWTMVAQMTGCSFSYLNLYVLSREKEGERGAAGWVVTWCNTIGGKLCGCLFSDDCDTVPCDSRSADFLGKCDKFMIRWCAMLRFCLRLHSFLKYGGNPVPAPPEGILPPSTPAQIGSS